MVSALAAGAPMAANINSAGINHKDFRMFETPPNPESITHSPSLPDTIAGTFTPNLTMMIRNDFPLHTMQIISAS
jgi:hypothetical protein